MVWLGPDLSLYLCNGTPCCPGLCSNLHTNHQACYKPPRELLQNISTTIAQPQHTDLQNFDKTMSLSSQILFKIRESIGGHNMDNQSQEKRKYRAKTYKKLI